MQGARVYEPQDYENALALMASRQLPLDRMITGTVPLQNVQEAFEELDRNPDAMKVLIQCA